ncbi:sensor histidine kinase [Sulfurimonas sp. CS5]|jgi:signal transduction histidine kinase|uniref:sensor histidine kinase n=1 Tax=Sulfurimonas sp. CS5 TaxID=3391145 RepID=UPI0039EA93A3
MSSSNERKTYVTRIKNHSVSAYKKYFYILLGIIASVELLIMIALQYVDVDSELLIAFLDTLLLTILTFPLIIIFVINPFSKEMNKGITEELNKKIDEVHNQNKIIIAQSRQAAMGDMLGMIAHQWRQPLTSMGMSIQNIQIDSQLGESNADELYTTLGNVLEQIQDLSKTIDEFNSFIKPSVKLNTCTLSDITNGTFAIIEKSLQSNNIKIKKSLKKDVEIQTYCNETIQVLINIINNARDIINEKEINDGVIEIIMDHDEQNYYLKILDNAGGIPDDIINKIFEPYYSTKEGKNGTGLGLYMSHMIVKEQLKGEIIAENIDRGACFTISCPLKID